jgi:hypothetical protein
MKSLFIFFKNTRLKISHTGAARAKIIMSNVWIFFEKYQEASKEEIDIETGTWCIQTHVRIKIHKFKLTENQAHIQIPSNNVWINKAIQDIIQIWW